METRAYGRKIFLILLLLCYAALDVQFLYVAFHLNADNANWLNNLPLIIGFLSEIFVIYSPSPRKRLIHVATALLTVFGLAIMFLSCDWEPSFLLIPVVIGILLIPMAIVFGISKLPVNERIKRAIYLAAFAFLQNTVTGFFGDAIRVPANVLVSIIGLCIALKGQQEKRWVTLLIFVGMYLIFFFIGSYIFTTFPAICSIIGITVTYLILSTSWAKKAKAVSIIVFTILLTVFTGFFAEPACTYLISIGEEERQQARIAEDKMILDYTFITPEGETLAPETLQGKQVTIMFWSKYCGICHERMPDFSQLASNYAADSTKVFIAAFLPIREGDTAHYNETRQENCAFRWVMATDARKIMDDLHFNAVPHLTILDTDGTVLYNGLFSDNFVYDPKKYLK